MEKNKNVREDFLRSFTAQIIRNMISSGMIKTYPDLEKIKQQIKIYEKPESTLANVILMNQNQEVSELIKPFGQVKQMSEKAIEPSIKQNVSPKIPFKKNIMPSFMNNPLNSQKFIKPQPMPVPPANRGMRVLPSNSRPSIMPMTNVKPVMPSPATEMITVLGISKIDNLLKDANVQTIECPGPNKQILVYRGGNIQATSLTLGADEIQNIMKEISDKARIPLMSGVFKAAYGNIIVTAVMSDFVGTRFIINKKTESVQNQSTSMYK